MIMKMRMEERIKAKLRSSKGFTLGETLLAILILLMVTTIVAAGIPVARDAYEKVVLASNAEVLLSTTITTLRNELGTAQDVKKPVAETGEKANTVITYYNPTRGASSKIYVASDGTQGIMFQRYYSEDGLSAAYEPSPLLPPKTSTQDLYVTYEEVTYDKDKRIVTFFKLSVNRTSGAQGLASRERLSIRVISHQDD